MGGDRRGFTAPGGGFAVPDLGMGRVLGTQTLTDGETGWEITVPAGTNPMESLYGMLREQILLLQGRVTELEAQIGYHLEGVEPGDPGAGGE